MMDFQCGKPIIQESDCSVWDISVCVCDSVFLFDHISEALVRLHKPDDILRAYYASNIIARYDPDCIYTSIVDIGAFRNLLGSLR